MKKVKEALQNIKDNITVLNDYCENRSSCSGCIMNGEICDAIGFESILGAIEEWQNKHD